MEVRFYPLLRYPEVLLDFFQDIIDQYDSLNRSATTVELRHELKAIKFFAENNRCGFSIENLDNFKFFDIELNKLHKLFSVLKVKQIVRIGVRSVTLVDCGTTGYENCIKQYATYQLNLSNTALQGDAFKDFSIIIDGKSTNGGLKVVTGIVNMKEVDSRYPDYRYEKTPQVSVFHDIDNFCNDQNMPINDKLIPSMLKENLKLVEENLESQNELFSDKE